MYFKYLWARRSSPCHSGDCLKVTDIKSTELYNEAQDNLKSPIPELLQLLVCV
jgi:hypothetical protein